MSVYSEVTAEVVLQSLGYLAANKHFSLWLLGNLDFVSTIVLLRANQI